MRYENDVCAGCGKNFAEGDDIVVCPECGTPQHRACYEKNSECVNAHLHESGFVWKGNESAPKKEEKKEDANGGEGLVCPTCGHINPPQSACCEACGQKFTFFGLNILEKELELVKKDEDEARRESGNANSVREENNSEYIYETPETDIDRMINSRARIIAPGLTKAQEQERLCGQPIKRVLVFVSSGATQYVNKFRKMEAGSRSWNWAAFFFTPYWFFYRKLYKPGMIFLALHVALSLLSIPFSTRMADAMNAFQSAVASASTSESLQAAQALLMRAALPYMMISAAFLIISVVSALIADSLYKKYVTEKLSFAETIKEPIAFSQYFLRFSSVNYIITALAIFVGNLLPNIISELFM